MDIVEILSELKKKNGLPPGMEWQPPPPRPSPFTRLQTPFGHSYLAGSIAPAPWERSDFDRMVDGAVIGGVQSIANGISDGARFVDDVTDPDKAERRQYEYLRGLGVNEKEAAARAKSAALKFDRMRFLAEMLVPTSGLDLALLPLGLAAKAGSKALRASIPVLGELGEWARGHAASQKDQTEVLK